MLHLAVRSKKDFLLAFLYAPGGGGQERQPIQGITRFEKLVFLALRDVRFQSLDAQFGYKPDNFGPFSDVLQDDLEALADLGLVQKTRRDTHEMAADELLYVEGGEVLARPVPVVFSLTEVGARIARHIWEALEPAEREAIARVKGEFNQVSLNALLSHVYLTSAPEWTSKSVVRDKYLQ